MTHMWQVISPLVFIPETLSPDAYIENTLAAQHLLTREPTLSLSPMFEWEPKKWEQEQKELYFGVHNLI